MKKSNISLLALTVLLFLCTLFTAAYGQVITNFSPTTTSAGSGSQITINGSGFGIGPASTTNYVEFAKADDGGVTRVKPALVEYVSWADDKVVVIVSVVMESVNGVTQGSVEVDEIKVKSVDTESTVAVG